VRAQPGLAARLRLAPAARGGRNSKRQERQAAGLTARARRQARQQAAAAAAAGAAAAVGRLRSTARAGAFERGKAGESEKGERPRRAAGGLEFLCSPQKSTDLYNVTTTNSAGPH
jgi:hypothetical protein